MKRKEGNVPAADYSAEEIVFEERVKLELSRWRAKRQEELGPYAFIPVCEELEAARRIRDSMVQTLNLATDFFQRNTKERPEVIEGLLHEGDLGNLAGPFGVGKSPLLADLQVRLLNGIDCYGRSVQRRPVILFDCETPGPDFRKTMSAICNRFGVATPRVPDELDAYLERDDPNEPATRALLTAISQPGHGPTIRLIRDALGKKPNSVVFIDPLEMLFRLDTVKKADVLTLYRELRNTLAKFPAASVISTFNLRKMDKRNGRADLLSDPRGWLEEICGSLDISNRSDVRLGIDNRADDVRVVNGIVRGREMQPILIRPFQNAYDQVAGFEQVSADQLALVGALSSKQKEYWDKLLGEFKFEPVADSVVPRSTLSRIVKITLSLGALDKGSDGVFRKVS